MKKQLIGEKVNGLKFQLVDYSDTSGYSSAEIRGIAHRIEVETQDYIASKEDLHNIFPQLKTCEIVPVVPNMALSLIALHLIERNTSILWTEEHPPHHVKPRETIGIIRQLIPELSTDTIKAFFNLAEVSWLEAGNVLFISDKLDTSQMADWFLNGDSNPKGTTLKRCNNLI